MTANPGKARPGHIALLLFAILVASSSVIMIKASRVHPVLQASYRLIMAGLFLLPFFFRELKRNGIRLSARLILPSVLPGIVLGLHFISWIAGARLTLAGNSTVIVNMLPVVMPFLAFFLIGEKPKRAEILGTSVSLLGLVLLAAFDFRLDRTHFLGDIVCFLSMLLYALYLMLGKRNNPGGRLWTYLVPLYLIGGLFCFVVSLPFAHPVRGLTALDVLMTVGLALGPTVIGHSVFNLSMKRFASQVVSLLNVFQFVFAGLLAFVLFGERPGWEFFVTSAFIVSGAAIAILSPNNGNK
jgi:drug/metabolite transporter (DMT)-like permease